MHLILGGVLASLLVQFSIAVDKDKKCGGVADIAFVLDSSRSIWYKHFDKEKEFVDVLVDKFNVKSDKTQVAALQFAQDVRVEFNFNQVKDAADVKAKVNAIQQSKGGKTYTHLALEAARTQLFDPKNGARSGVPKIIILISDGASTQAEMTLAEANLVKQANITLLAIGIGHQINPTELRAVVTPPAKENFFFAPSFDELENPNFQALVGNKACDQNETPDKTCQGKEADVVFVLDKSSSIWPVNFQEQLQFVNHVIDVFDVNSGKTQVGVVVFSNSSDVVFDLDRYDNKDDVMTAVLGIEQTGGITNTHLALQLVMDRMFTKAGGSRPGVAHICIVITDGVSRLPALTVELAQEMHDRGIYTFAMGVGNKTDPVELAAIASDPDTDFVFEVNGYDALPRFRDILAYRTCKVKSNTK